MGFFSTLLKPFGSLGNALGGQIDSNRDTGGVTPQQQFDTNVNLQREFAQNGIRWKVADAQAAGIHPLYALGAPPTSFSPISVGSDPVDSFGSSSAAHFSDLGQDLSRAIDSTRTKPERVNARMDALSLERAELENAYLRSRIALTDRTQVGPPLPSVNPLERGLSPDVAERVDVKPVELNAAALNDPSLQAGQVTDVAHARTASGGYAVMPSNDVKQLMEDSFVPEAMWSLRNYMIPWWNGSSPSKPDVPLKPGHVWDYNRWTAEWHQVPYPMAGRKPRIPGSFNRRVTF